MRWRQLIRAVWAMRILAGFMVGPALGLLVTAATFGLAPGLVRLAAAVALFGFALLGLLIHAEYVRLSGPGRG